MRLLQIDAFTSEAFRGNPAAVCILAAERGQDWMQSVAAEMNLSETAFLLRRDDGFGLRWFTPTVEVALCGHATLASAHALWEEGLLSARDTARFQTSSGLLTAVRSGGKIELDFPATRAAPADAPPGLLAALGVRTAAFVGRNVFDYVVELDDEHEVRSLQPDHAQLRSIPARGIIVTSRSRTAGFDFLSRFFAPGSGIDEDPVTGSAHTCLAPYWADKLGRREMTAWQASPRGGVLEVALHGDRVKLRGEAVTVLRGELLV